MHTSSVPAPLPLQPIETDTVHMNKESPIPTPHRLNTENLRNQSKLPEITIFESLMRGFGLFQIIIGMLFIIALFMTSNRFDRDNAFGAVANAIEKMQLVLLGMFFCICGIALYFYQLVRRINRNLRSK